jgi:peptidyl-prolyl cis-trans isomerase A (cyclophilin A)
MKRPGKSITIISSAGLATVFSKYPDALSMNADPLRRDLSRKATRCTCSAFALLAESRENGIQNSGVGIQHKLEILNTEFRLLNSDSFSLEFWWASTETVFRKSSNFYGKGENSMRLTVLSLMILASLSFALATGLAANPQGEKSNAEKLLNPAQLNETAPAKFQVKFDTSKGEFIVEVTREWAPNGTDRFYNLVKNGFFDNCRFYRVVKNFMVQFGMNGDPKITRAWSRSNIKDDPLKQSNKRGYVTFAMTSQPNSRTTQVFINYNDRNVQLDSSGFAPFGKVIQGMNIVDAIYSDYGDMPAMRGTGPDPNQIFAQGNAYLEKNFPKLDYIKTATIVPAAK